MSTKRDWVALLHQQFSKVRAERADREPSWMGSFRDNAWARFAALGIPTKKSEEWSYTSVTPILEGGFSALRPGEASTISQQTFDARLPEPVSTLRLVFVDGVFDAGLSQLPATPEGGYIGSLSVFLRAAHEDSLHSRLARMLDSRVANPFAFLNMAMFEDGAYLSIPRNIKLEQPIELVYLASGHAEESTPRAYHTRNLICVGDGSEISLIERYIGASGESEESYWSNVATTFFLGKNAVVEHVKLQQEANRAYHIAQQHIEQERDSLFTSHLFSWGGATSRHEVETVLGGENIRCKLGGLYLGQTGQHMDNRICMEHACPHGYSDQYYKGILTGSGSGVFSGRILVRQQAQKTDAYQTNQTMLLSDDAAVYSKPQLEIYADDVKCSHGATSGNIDQNALFYLRSRGIPQAQSERMLIQAFAQELVERVSHEALQQQLTQMLTERLDAMQRQGAQ